MNFKEEDNYMFNKFLEDHFFSGFRKGKYNIELIISPNCNIGCRYCYINKYRNKIFEQCIFDNSNLLSNLDKVLKWMIYNKFVCNVEIFSGELFAQEIGYDVVEKILDFYSNVPQELRIKGIVIPTNFTFINSDEHTARIEGYIEAFNNIGVPMFLSASFDGKYLEQNRPYVKNLDITLNKERDDEYYDKVFAFCKKHNYGFHPMVYYDGIELWQKNFEWFQEMFEKHGIDWSNIYLLTVRNDGWTTEANKHLYRFIQYLIDFAFDKCDKDRAKFKDFLLKGQNGFNILSAPLMEHDRGIGCGLQTSIGIRVSDLTHSPCHRTMYPDFQLGKFVEDVETVLRYETTNASLGLAVYGFNVRMQQGCVECPINRLCLNGCIGSQFETNKDLFSPIKSVCGNNWWLTKAIVDGFARIGVLDDIKAMLMNSKKKQIEFMQSFSVKLD